MVTSDFAYVFIFSSFNVIESFKNESNLIFIDKFLKSCRLFELLSEEKVGVIGSYIEKRVYRQGKNIIKDLETRHMSSLLYVMEGTVTKKTVSCTKIVAKAGELINEYETLSKLPVAGYSIEADVKDCVCVILSLRLEVIESNISINLMRFYLQSLVINNPIELQKARLIAHLGKGSYGYVNLIKYDKDYFALKSMRKDKFDKGKNELIELVHQEKKNLASLNSPFTLKLYQVSEDANFFHFITEYVDGHTLQDLIDGNLLCKNEYLNKFYMSNLLIILDYLHKQKVVHRDIKPMNIMVAPSGFLKLIDFGLSKKIKDYTYTIIGSPYFMAPEVLKGSGYNTSCDYWSAGVSLYKMYFNKYPFGEYCKSSVEVYSSILKDDLSFPLNPSENRNSDIIKVLKLLLSKPVSKRPMKINNYEAFCTNLDDIIELKPSPYILKQKSRIGTSTDVEGVEFDPEILCTHFSKK